MNFKEALETIQYLNMATAHMSSVGVEFDDLRAFVESQQAEIDAFESTLEQRSKEQYDDIVKLRAEIDMLNAVIKLQSLTVANALQQEPDTFYSANADDPPAYQQAEIKRLRERYETVCPDCGGYGYHESDEMRCDENGECIGSEAVRIECSRCDARGHIPRVILPDNFVKVLVNAKSVEDIEDYLLKNATHLPEGWELEREP